MTGCPILNLDPTACRAKDRPEEDECMDQDLAQKGSADWNPAAGTREAEKSGDQAFKLDKCDI